MNPNLILNSTYNIVVFNTTFKRTLFGPCSAGAERGPNKTLLKAEAVLGAKKKI